MFVGSEKETKVNWNSPALQYTWAGIIVAIGIAITLSGFIFTQRWGEVKAQNALSVASDRSAMAGTSRFNWLRLPCRRTCSRKSWA